MSSILSSSQEVTEKKQNKPRITGGIAPKIGQKKRPRSLGSGDVDRDLGAYLTPVHILLLVISIRTATTVPLPTAVSPPASE